MADRIQLDGKTFMPLMEAAAMVAISEKQVMALAQSGQVFLRAIGKKVYVDINGLQAATHSALAAPAAAPVSVAAVAQAPSVPAQMPAPAPFAPRVVEMPRVVAPPAPAPAPVALPTHPLHMSSAELSAMAPKDIAIALATAPQSQTPSKPLPRMVLPPKPPAASTGGTMTPLATALAAFVFMIGSGVVAYEKSPNFARIVGNVGEQVAAVAGFGNTVTYQAIPGTVGNSPIENGPSELQASASASTLPGEAASTTQPIYYVYNYPVIERVVQEVRYIQADGPEDFAQQLNDLYERIQNQIRGLNVTTNTQFAQQYQVIAQTNNIDKLGSVTITDSIFSGGTIDGTTLTNVSFGSGVLLGVGKGGTGTSTAPSYGQLLLGNAAGGYDYIATSSLGLAGGGTGTAGQVSYYESNGSTVSATSSLFIASTGNIGIGTTSPSAKLEVAHTSSGATAEQLYLTNAASATSTASRLTFRAADVSGIATSTGSITSILQQNYNGGIGDLAFATLQSGTLTEVFRATGLGNVGIGTSTPLRRFAVEQAASVAQFSVAYDTTRVTEIQTDSSGDVVINPSGDDVRINDDNLWVCAGGSCPSGTPNGTGKLLVETALGVGTSTPIWPLTASHATLPQLSLTDASATSDTWTFRSIGNSLYIATSTFSATSTQPAVTVTPNGFVGIGTTSPSQQLSASGLLFVGANGAAGMGTATSTFYGDIKIIGKLDVGTIDPVYTIDGIKYATYGHSTVGIKEEVTLKVTPPVWNAEKKMYAYVIDFDSLEKGSDLWLFYQVTDFGKQWKSLVTSLTPSFDGRVYYEEDTEENTLTVYASESAPISVRLIASRFDFSKWANLRPDQDGDTAGTHVIDEK